ncbi:MAG: protein translocase subunit SecD [Actinomycetota bacterium]|nr:protein translocase subunit SecD [Actinomycetota bacterium]
MRNKKVHITIIIIFIIIIGVSFYYIFKDSIANSINLGLDLKGGTQIILMPIKKGTEEITSGDLDEIIKIIGDRINKLGVSEPLITKDSTDNIIVQLPGVKDPERAKELIGKTAQLEFRLVTGTFITIKDQNWDLVKFDPEEGELIIDPTAEEILLVDDINSLINKYPYTIVGKLLDDPESGEKLLIEYNGEDSQEEDADTEGDTGIIDTEKIIGKIIYDSETGELLLTDYNDGSEIGEILVDSRTSAATLVGPVLLKGNNLARAAAGYDSSGKIRVALSVKDEAVGIFEEITTENIGKPLAIVLDEEIKSAPYLRVPITNGEAEITGIDDLEEAKNIEIVLQFGAFPVDLKIEESSTVGPTLGMDSLNRGLYAGIIGFVLIIIFMFFFYKGLGLYSAMGLIIYVVLFWGIISAMGAALTLPGIAGLILTIGMAVDANVIIFARIREEALKNKSTRVAIGYGFKNALRTIIDSNITTLITALALYRFGTGPIRGFAVTLSLGVVISMVVSLLFTRSFMFLMSGFPRFATPGFLGIKRESSE